MERRRFKLHRSMDNLTTSSLIDVPHIAVLHYRTMDELIQAHTSRWGTEPVGICLPVTAQDGLLFEIEDVTLPISRYASKAGRYVDFESTLKDASERFDEVYLSLDPTLRFCSADALHIEDIKGDSSSQVCFGNPAAIALCGAILGTAVDIALSILKNTNCRLSGAALDCVDLFPLGAEEQRVSLTCFCPSCVKWIEDKSPGLVTKFRDFPNPWNLVLSDSGSGVSQISEIAPTSSPTEIVGLSRLKKFDVAFTDRSDANLIEQARLLLRYIETRHQQVVHAAHSIFNDALNGLEAVTPKRIVIMEGAKYDWTAGLQLARLDTADRRDGGFDELWFHPTSPEIIPLTANYRPYMWRRTRYFLDAFFQFSFSVSDKTMRATTGIGLLSEDDAKARLYERLATASGSEVNSSLDLSAVISVGSMRTNLQGFTSVAFDEKFGEAFIRDLSIPKGRLPNDMRGLQGSALQQLLEMMSTGKPNDSD
jgi:hypothetical protein